MSKLRLKRRWFQFSLRTIFIVMTLLALWLGYITHRARQQKQAVEAIEKLGGEVSYDYEQRFDDDPPGPAWLRELIGVDYFANVTVVSLEDTQISDAGLEHLKGLTSLEWLSLNDTSVTDAGLEHLKGLTKLVALNLDGTQITDAGLEHLKGLTKLIVLNLDGTQITDAGLVHLESLANLWDLELNDTQVGDAGLEHMKGLTNLGYLSLDETEITDAGVSELQKALPKCQVSH